MAKARLETTLTGDESPFVQAVNRAEKRAQGFQGKLQTLFRRDPTARAQRALGGFVGDLASGDVGTAISSIATRLHGVGLAAGIGIGAAVIVFQKAKEQLDEVDKAVQKVNAGLARPLSAQAALGPQGIRAEFEQTIKAGEELAEKRHGFFAKIQEAAIRSQPGGFDTATMQPYEPDRVPPAQRAQTENRRRQYALAQLIVKADERDEAVQREAVYGSERAAELAKIHREEVEKRAKLLLQPIRNFTDVAVKVSGIAGSFQDEDRRANVSLKKFDLKKQEEIVENRILDLHDSTLSKDQQALSALRMRIGLLRQEFNQPGTIEQKAAIRTQLHVLRNQFDETQFTQFQEYKKDPGEYERKKRKAVQTRSDFELEKAAYFNSRSHGAFNQTGFMADLLGPNAQPVGSLGVLNNAGGSDQSGDSNDGMLKKLDDILGEIRKWNN